MTDRIMSQQLSKDGGADRTQRANQEALVRV